MSGPLGLSPEECTEYLLTAHRGRSVGFNRPMLEEIRITDIRCRCVPTSDGFYDSSQCAAMAMNIHAMDSEEVVEWQSQI